MSEDIILNVATTADVLAIGFANVNYPPINVQLIRISNPIQVSHMWEYRRLGIANTVWYNIDLKHFPIRKYSVIEGNRFMLYTLVSTLSNSQSYLSVDRAFAI